KIKKFNDDIETYEKQRDEIIKKLRALEAVKELQKRREEKEVELEKTKNSLVALQTKKISWLGKNAIKLVSRRLTSQTLDFVKEEELHGRIPSPYNEDFVKSILQKETCICGRDVKPESPEWAAVTHLLSYAAN